MFRHVGKFAQNPGPIALDCVSTSVQESSRTTASLHTSICSSGRYGYVRSRPGSPAPGESMFSPMTSDVARALCATVFVRPGDVMRHRVPGQMQTAVKAAGTRSRLLETATRAGRIGRRRKASPLDTYRDLPEPINWTASPARRQPDRAIKLRRQPTQGLMSTSQTRPSLARLTPRSRINCLKCALDAPWSVDPMQSSLNPLLTDNSGVGRWFRHSLRYIECCIYFEFQQVLITL